MEKVVLKGGTALLDVEKILRTVGVEQGFFVADLGCGGGGHFVSPTAALVGPTGRVYALDIQKRVLHTVESRIKLQGSTNVILSWSNLEKLGAATIPEKSCDVAFLVNVLFQNKEYGTILREAARFLKIGGKLVVIEWRKSAVPFGPPLEFRIDPAILQSLAKDASLSLSGEFEPGLYHYGRIYLKS